MFKDLFIRPLFNEARARVTFSVPENVRVERWVLWDGKRRMAEGDCAVESGGSADFSIDMAGFTPWSVDAPYLYTLSLEGTNGEDAFEHRQRFGMTRIHVENRTLHFNGRPLYLRGHIRGREAHDHPNLMNGPQEEYYAKNIRMSKAYGFNLIRFHSRVPDEAFLDLADELGMLIHVEIRKYFGRYQKERKSKGFSGNQTLVDEADWEAMVLRLRNHPCVLAYCMGNEINNPGCNERVRIIRNLTLQLDPTRLFLDTCSRGEYDRDTVDFDVQHMSYFAPFGRNADMFDDSIHLAIYGSVEGRPMTVQPEEGEAAAYRLRREVPVRRPLLAHEVAHYTAIRDPYRLEESFARYGSEKPWWVDELKRMIEAKGLKEKFDRMLEASVHFQYIWIKQCVESVRKSPRLQGFHMLQLADTDRYENANGLLDCFDDPKAIGPERFLPLNGPTVLVADLPRRTLRAGQTLTIPVYVSHFPTTDIDRGDLSFRLTDMQGEEPAVTGTLPDVDLDRRGNYRIARLELPLPDVVKPVPFRLSLELTGAGEPVRNEWDMWVFPDRPDRVPATTVTTALRDVSLSARYPQLTCRTDGDNTESLLIADRFTPEVLAHLAAGKDALVLYRIEENRSRDAERESLYLPSTWERFKAIIWDRGHNSGGFIRPHPIIEDFPHTGLVDWQFYDLIEDSDKIDLDDFPVPVEPIIEGVDKAVRDRYDVGRLGLPEFQYAYTLRTFAYLFEVKVGPGRLVVAPLNFTQLDGEHPAVCWLFESILLYMGSNRFAPKATIGTAAFEAYLKAKGAEPRIKERMMTQYWQQDRDPLETKAYWAESEAWIREDPMGDPSSHWAATPWLDPSRT